MGNLFATHLPDLTVDSLLAYLNSIPTDQQRALAEACSTSIGYLRKACSVGQKLGADLCIAIERESAGAVRCEELRPDVDWAYVRATSAAPASGAGEAA